MPCRDYDQDPMYDAMYKIQDLQKQNDRLARIACTTLTYLENIGADADLLKSDKEVSDWWKKHKIADAKAKADEEKKLAEEAEKARLKKLRAEVISRLTDEEKKALGIKKK